MKHDVEHLLTDHPHESLDELRVRDPSAHAEVLRVREASLRARLIDGMTRLDPRLGELARSVDRGVADLGQFGEHLARELGARGLPREVAAQGRAMLGLTGDALKSAPTGDLSITRTPELRSEIDRARLAAVLRASSVPDAKLERVERLSPSVAHLDDSALGALVTDGVLDEEQARRLGARGEILEALDGDLRLFSSVAEHGGESLSVESAAALSPLEWRALLERSGSTASDGASLDDRARALSRRFAELRPEAALAGRLPRTNATTLARHMERLAPVIGGEHFGFDADLAVLAPQVSAGELEELRAAQAEVRTVARAHPGLRLETVATDRSLSTAEKAKEISRRLDLVAKVRSARSEVDLLGLDYSPGSRDVQALALADLGIGHADQARVLETLKAEQRAYTLAGNTADAVQLMLGGYHSAHQVVGDDLQTFARKADLDPERAEQIHGVAREAAAQAGLTLAALWGLLRDRDGWSSVDNVEPTTVERLLQIPGLEQLFGSQDYCDCEHCKSIFGPAAYFVDTMAFVDEKIRKKYFAGPRSGAHLLDLKTRRPDLWELELTCENTNERVPTLDLVAEILEAHIAKRSGYAGNLRDRASVEAHVYGPVLSTSKDGFRLPFSLGRARVDAYLGALSSGRGALARAFGAAPAVATRAELRLSLTDYDLIANADANAAAQERYYGRTLPLVAGVVTAFDTRALLEPMGVTREELDVLFASSFVRAGGAAPQIRSEKSSAASVQADVERVYGLTLDALDRMHRFVRLARHAGWTFFELELALRALGTPVLDAAVLSDLAAIHRISSERALGVEEVVALFAAIPTAAPVGGGTSLFDRIFNPPLLIASGGTLPQAATSPRFVHPTFRAGGAGAPDPMLVRLQASLGLDLDQLGVLIERLVPTLGFDRSAANEADRGFALTTENLSLLYRHAVLAKLLGLGVAQLFQLLALAPDLPSARVTSLGELVSALDHELAVRRAGIQLDDLAFVTGSAPLVPGRYPTAASVAAAVREGASEAMSFSDTIFAAKLGVSEDLSRTIIAANGAIIEPTGAKYRLVAAWDPTTAPAVPAGAGVTPAQIAGVLRPFHASERLVVQACPLLSTSADKLRAIFVAAGVSLTDAALVRSVRGDGSATALETALAPALRLAVLFAPAAFDVAAIDYARAQTARFGATPLTGISVGTVLALRRSAQMLAPSADPNAPLPSGNELRAALDAWTAAGFSSAVEAPLASLLGVGPALVRTLRTRIGAAGPALDALDRLRDAVERARTLGADGEAISRVYSDDEGELRLAARALEAALAARGADAAESAALLGRAEEPVREAKREALADYIVHALHPELERRSELYPYFLIDVEAGGCSTTSRVVAATSSLQLYVHRVLLGLEQDTRSPADPEHVAVALGADDREEWSWRKNYRVWEANRKVFVYPESYIEPDLRDDKTPLFEELEQTLLQQEIDDQTVLDAYSKYLRGFEEIASLRIAGVYHDRAGAGEAQHDVLHIFGVTSSDPPTYYYRTVEGLLGSLGDAKVGATWSAWRKVDAQITARRVAPIVHRGRLHVFWTDVRTRPVNKVANGGSEFAGYQHSLRARYTTLRLDGAWTAPQELALPVFDGSQGRIADPIDDAKRPKYDGRVHEDPIDDYSLVGPCWEAWPSVQGSSEDERLVLFTRNFLSDREVDLFKNTTRPRTVFGGWPYPQMLCERAGSLYYGHPKPWALLLPVRWPEATLANLVIEASRISEIGKESPLYKPIFELGLYEEQIATLPAGTELTAVNGSAEDAIVQVGPDVLLLAGSVRNDAGYVAVRLGTTLAEEVSRRLFVGGIDGLLDLDTQRALREAGLPITKVGDLIQDRANAGKLDFAGPYGTYYREIFFHIPFLLANHLNAAQHYPAAQRWYHFIFDPTATEAIDPDLPPAGRAKALRDRVWRYLELRGLGLPRLRDALTDPNALATYRRDPFNPHAIARLRLSAYQKAIVMKYIDNLLDWADYLFTQFTMESVNEATMLYALAADILGPRPAKLGSCGEGAASPRDYAHIAPLLDQSGDVLVELETWIQGPWRVRRRIPKAKTKYAAERAKVQHAKQKFSLEKTAPAADASAKVVATEAGRDAAFQPWSWSETRTASWAADKALGPKRGPKLALGREVEHRKRARPEKKLPDLVRSYVRQLTPVFCVPPNKDLLAYWGRVEDRLFKIRHCQDINGQRRELSLFAPEIDPRLLVRMRAAGLSLDDVLAVTNGNVPPYRFAFLIERAKAFAGALQAFGAALLSALEKKDNEELGRLRTVHQQNLQRLSTQLRRWELETAEQVLAGLEAQQAAATYRLEFYASLMSTDRSTWETTQSTARHLASGIYTAEAALQFIGGISSLLPQLGSPFAMKYGGVELSGWAGRTGNSLNAAAKVAEAIAASAGLEASFERRREGWEHQRQLAQHDLANIAKQMEAAKIRIEIAERSLELHETSIEQLDEVLEHLDKKFTNLGLYTHLAGELRGLHRTAFNNALSMAQLAEQAFRFERGDDATLGLSTSYWEPTRAGLLAGERLLQDLLSLERRYYETNYRSLEIDQAFSLQQLDPSALLALRTTGECTFSIPEAFFDLYYPGHYKRRIRAVRLTIPCVTGPFTNVSATLTLLGSQLRTAPSAAPGARVDVPPRRSVSVATSTAQNDAGVFELSFRDERYMPFEGAGAVSTWRLMLPKVFTPFDYETMGDVIISISYSAEADQALRAVVEANSTATVGSLRAYFANNPLRRVLSLRQDFSSAFHRLLHSAPGTAVSITVDDRHLPIFVRGRAVQVDQARLAVRTRGGAPTTGLRLTVDGGTLADLDPQASLAGLSGGALPVAFGANLRGGHTLSVTAAGALANPAPSPGDASALDASKVEDVLVYFEYRLT